jgi:hypothetical protein
MPKVLIRKYMPSVLTGPENVSMADERVNARIVAAGASASIVKGSRIAKNAVDLTCVFMDGKRGNAKSVEELVTVFMRS